MIDSLVAALNQELGLTGKEIADVLWLWPFLQTNVIASDEVTEPTAHPQTMQPDREVQTPAQADVGSGTEARDRPPKSAPSPDAELHASRPRREAGDRTEAGLPIKVPGARSVREPLTLAKALRPLIQRVESGLSTVLDEVATVDRIASEDIWMPVLKPTLEPLLELALVVDNSPSMDLWRRTVVEMERLMANYGVFRDVRVWMLDTDEQNQIKIAPKVGNATQGQSAHRPSELIDPNGRRLILVVTDCTSTLWRDGTLFPTLKLWADSGLMSIVQMLPERLWARTGLGIMPKVMLHSTRSGLSNRQLRIKDIPVWQDVDVDAGIRIPIVTLEADPFLNWAKMLSAKGGVWSPGVIFEPCQEALAEPWRAGRSHAEDTSAQRVQTFRNTASSTARRLAGLLAAAPFINLPVVRIIREQFLPKSQQVHVAEVFLSGLLQPVSSAQSQQENEQYVFFSDIRDILLESVPTSDSKRVVQEVSRFIAERLGLSLEDFVAVLMEPSQSNNPTLVSQTRAFARMSAHIFKNMGPEYAEFAEGLERNAQPAEPNTAVAPSLQRVDQTGLYEDLDKLPLEEGTQPFLETRLSDFLVFHLEQCSYAGVSYYKIASRNFSEKDVEDLDELANQLSYRRPRDRAGYYLSAAKILVDLGQKAEERRPSIFLRNFCAAMGDACIAEQTDRAVARSYYAEAFLIAPEWANQLSVKLSQFVMLEYAPNEELLKPNPPQIEDALEAVFKMDIPKISTSVVKGLLDLSRLNSEILRFLMRWVYPNQEIREPLKAVCYEILGESGESSSDDESEFLSLWKRGQTLMQQLDQGVNADIAYLRSSSNNLDTLKAQIAEVQKLESKMLISLDRQRLSQVRQVLNSIYEYAQQQTYGEREYSATRIQNSINQTIEGIEKNPTKYSWELFRPYLVALSERIEEHFNEIKRAAEPEELRTELAIESLPNQSEIECQITITNEQGKSPANTVVVSLEDSPDNDYTFSQRDIPATETLSGGTSVTCRIPLSVVSKAQEAQLFTLYYKLSYSTRTQSKIESRGALAVPLYSATDFQEIHNPYATYAQGTAVTEETMFYGRDQMLERLRTVLSNPASVSNFIIYGQKRVGKSSLLYHLQNQLEFPCVPISFSIGDIGNNLSIASFLSLIIQKLEETFADMEDEGFPVVQIEGPSIKSIQNSPDLEFHNYMMKLRRFLRRNDAYRNARIVLLIDEFSYIYGSIRKGDTKDTFIKFWKAILERQYFSSVIVGHDIMLEFIKRFPNEFQGSTIRLPYLSHSDAERLIVDPIRIPETGESRYRGSAVNQMLKLTDGNPYYIQILCERLVQYMNRKRSAFVTDADIKQVEQQELLRGNQSLQPPQFDNLLSADEDVADGITSEDAEKVLREIARKSQRQMWCDRETITAQTTSATVNRILEDLHKREVIDKKGTLFRIRIELFKHWLLLN